MLELNAFEVNDVAGGLMAADGAGEFFAAGGGAYAGEAFFAGMMEGAEIGAAGGPVGVIGGLLVGAAVVAIWRATE